MLCCVFLCFLCKNGFDVKMCLVYFLRAKGRVGTKMDLMQSKNVFLFSVHFAGAKTYFCKAKCSAQLHILLPMATAAGQHFLRSL